nr:GIY-YIG nuclease family protein [uncultured Trichococcus sp.]
MDNINFTKNAAGFVYLLINASMPGMVKIGRTTRDPENRIEELSKATGVPTPFILVYKEFFSDCINAESVIHEMLEDKGYRLSPNREFFTVPIPDAISIIQNTSSKLNNLSENTISVISAQNNKVKNQLHNNKLSDLDQLKESLVESGEKYLSGEGNYLQDKKKAFKDLEQAGKLGSSRAYYIMGMTYFDSYSEYSDKIINTDKPLEYFDKGAKLLNADSRFCLAEMAKIYMGIYNDYCNDYVITHNSKVCWGKYIDKIKRLNYADLDDKDTEYLLLYISHIFSHRIEMLYDASMFDVFFNENRDLLRIINWMKYELINAVENFLDEHQDYGAPQSKKDKIYQYQFMELFLQLYFFRSEPYEICQIQFIRENPNGVWFKISIEKGRIQVGDIVKLTGPKTQYTQVLEIKKNDDPISEIINDSKGDILLDCPFEIVCDLDKIKLIKTGEFEYILNNHYLEIQKEQIWLDKLCDHLIDTAKINRYIYNDKSEWIKYYEKAGELGSEIAYELLAKEVYQVQEKDTIQLAIKYYEQGAQLNERGIINCLSGVAKIYQNEFDNNKENFDLDDAVYHWNEYMDGTTFSNFSFDTMNFIYWYILIFNYENRSNTPLNKNDKIIVLSRKIFKILNWFKQDFRENLHKQLNNFSKQQDYLIELTKTRYSFKHGLTFPEVREEIEKYTKLIERIKYAERFFYRYFDSYAELKEFEILNASVGGYNNIIVEVVLGEEVLQVGDILREKTTLNESFFKYKKIWNIQQELQYKLDSSNYFKVLEINEHKNNKELFQEKTLCKVKLEKSGGLLCEDDIEIINDIGKLIKVGSSLYSLKTTSNRNITEYVDNENIRDAHHKKSGSKSEIIDSSNAVEMKDGIKVQKMETFKKLAFEIQENLLKQLKDKLNIW